MKPATPPDGYPAARGCCCWRAKGWPLLRHVWPTFARAATGGNRGGQKREKPATAMRSGPGGRVVDAIG
jgi:hypothetical protein